MAVFWFSLLGLGIFMSLAAIWLAARDRRSEPPDQTGRHRGREGS